MANKKMMIRKAKKEDEKRVIELFREYDEYENRLDKRYEISSKKEAKEFFDLLIKNKIAVLLVLEIDNQIQGLISGEYRKTLMGKSCMIHQLIISKKLRAKGYGKKLLKELENYFKEKGCKNIHSLVFIKNKKVLNFYKKMKYSFKEEGFIIKKRLK